MPTPNKLFPGGESEPEDKPLVNQSAGDDIPFEPQTGDGAGNSVALVVQNVPPTDEAQVELLKGRLDRVLEMHAEESKAHENTRKEYYKLQEERDSLAEDVKLAEQARARATKEANDLLAAGVTPQAPAAPTNSFGRECFLAIIQGMASAGDLSVGKLTSDEHTSKHMRHAAGIASFAAAAAKDARL